MVTKPKKPHEIRAIKVSGKMLAKVLALLASKAEAGMSTKDLADMAAKELKSLGGVPCFLGFEGFPDVLCVSVNDEVVHGIPSKSRILKEGDIVGMDFGVTYDGMITDAAKSIIIGRPIHESHVELVKNTEKSLLEGISVVHNGVRTGDIGHAVESYLEPYGYGIVKDLVGHGVGHYLHEEPNIPNYGRANTGPWLEKNMTIAIEPMVTLGKGAVRVAKNGWTILTVDGSWSAHFEHTVLITESSAEILTAYPR
jgi:methionyl aminopeptidase